MLDPTTFVAEPIKENTSSSLDDVLSLIKEAQAVSDSMMDETMKSQQFVFETTCCKPSKKKTSFVWNNQQQKKNKKVRFAPKSKRCQIEYIDIPSALDCEQLYYSEEEQHAFVDEMHRDVDYVEDGRPESEEWTARGLEGRTEDGAADRTEVRLTACDAVLDEQDRQWATLKPNEPCDDLAIAWACLDASEQSREQAHRVGLQDQEEIHGEEKENNLMEEDSMATLATVPLGASLSTFGDYSILNRKGYRVQWPALTTEAQVFRYDHVQTQEEQNALWLPYETLEEIKQWLAPQIALLTTEEQPTECSDSLRGLEPYTQEAEERFRQNRLTMFLQVYSPHQDADKLARHCQKLSAKALRQARQRALKDQRSVKAYLYESAKKKKKKTLITRVPSLGSNKNTLITRVPSQTSLSSSKKQQDARSSTIGQRLASSSHIPEEEEIHSLEERLALLPDKQRRSFASSSSTLTTVDSEISFDY